MNSQTFYSIGCLSFMVYVDGQEHGLGHPNPGLTTTDQ